jgi:hypothetical protein
MRATALRSVLVIALAPAAAGCVVHTHAERNAPGYADVARPPADPKSALPETPRDPGERGLIVGASILQGATWTPRDGDRHAQYALATELSILPFALGTSHRGWITPKVLGGSVRASVGWTVLRVWNEKENESKTRIGGSWVEARYTRLDEEGLVGGSIALGAAWDWRRSIAGPQATGCLGIPVLFDVCLRSTYLFDAGTELGFHVALNAFSEWVWSR